MKCRCALALGAIGSALFIQTPVRAQTADVILGELIGPRVYAKQGDVVALSIGTTSCNAGDKVLDWLRLPDNKHPVITMNMYRLLGGRMTQIGQSWVKHGFVALQQNVCGFGCQANPSGIGLGIGCSDPYGAGTNEGPNLGSRRLVNPVTGAYDGATALQELATFQPASPIDHGLQVKESDLAVAGARFFMEGQYIAADDAVAGNGNNNVSHIEVTVTQDGSGNWIIVNAQPGPRPTVRETPAIRAWPYADFSVSDSGSEDGRIIVGHSVIRLSRTAYRYEYAIYNMNSERGVRSFSIPAGAAQLTNIGSSAAASHGEAWSNDPWQNTVENGRITWSTKTFEESENANAIRWGTTYNFWFESETPPTQADAEVGRFKAGSGPAAIPVKVQAPKG